MWYFLTETWTYDPNISRLVTALGILTVAGIAVLIYANKTKRRLLQGLWTIALIVVVALLIFSLARDCYRWVDRWEGEIVAAYSSRAWSFSAGGQTAFYYLEVKLDGLGPKIKVTVSPSTFSQASVGDYIVKRKSSYWPRIREY